MLTDPFDVVDRLQADGLSHEQALAECKRRHDAQIARNGYVVHLVFGDPDAPFGFNACTFGLEASYDHPDLQVVLRMPPGTACGLLSKLADMVKAGERFWAGETADGILPDLVVSFAAATEGGREVLRVILPDREGRTARGEIEGEFKRQYEGTIPA